MNYKPRYDRTYYVSVNYNNVATYKTKKAAVRRAQAEERKYWPVDMNVEISCLTIKY